MDMSPWMIKMTFKWFSWYVNGILIHLFLLFFSIQALYESSIAAPWKKLAAPCELIACKLAASELFLVHKLAAP